MAKKRSTAVKQVKETEPKATIDIDKSGPYVHVGIPDYNSWIKLFVNGNRVGIYQLENGRISIQLPGGLPNEYRIEVRILKK